MRRLQLCALLVLLSAALSARAEVVTIQADPAQSRISFTLGATFHTVHGTIPVSGGAITLNTATGKATGEMTAATSKADTGNDKRDRDMHNKVLESSRFPAAVFVFDRVEGKIEPGVKSRVTVHGQMRVHGASHPMSIPGTLLISGDRATADATFKVPYVQWGMRDPSKALIKVQKAVDVTLHLAGSVKR